MVKKSTKFKLKHDVCASRKAELGRYLSAMDWPTLFSSLDCCEDMLNYDVFYKAQRTGLDLLMPVEKVRVNTSHVPWMIQHLKSLINLKGLKGRRPFTNMVSNQVSLRSAVTE